MPIARPLGSAGYLATCALAEDHLRQGLTVVAESVTPLAITEQVCVRFKLIIGVQGFLNRSQQCARSQSDNCSGYESIERVLLLSRVIIACHYR